MMKIRLINIDSKIPNLALMKLSAWHKREGDTVGFGVVCPDRVYASSVFSKSRLLRRHFEQLYPHGVFGGTGWSLENQLPEEVEAICPDYDLYGIDYSMGFTSRGCIRQCPFCIVPQKEGDIVPVSEIARFLNPRSRRVMLLDNNFLASPTWRERIAETNRLGLKVDFNQGLDIRLLDEEVARALVSIHPPYLRFSWDDIHMEAVVRRGIEVLHQAGYKIQRQSLGFYVLVGFDSSHEEDLYRCNVLHGLNINTHIQVYEGANRLTRALARWGNRPRIWMKTPFENYSYGRTEKKQITLLRDEHSAQTRQQQKINLDFCHLVVYNGHHEKN
mgnify:CR=1 FL=1